MAEAASAGRKGGDSPRAAIGSALGSPAVGAHRKNNRNVLKMYLKTLLEVSADALV